MTDLTPSGDYIDLPPEDQKRDAAVAAIVPPERQPIALSDRPTGRTPVSITRIAHCMVLIEFDGKVVLTDPWFTETPEYHHGEPLGVGVDDLPELSAVVCSHAHYDHYDIEGFARYRDLGVPLLVGAFDDMAVRARAAGFTDVREVVPGDEQVIDGITITTLPGAHNVQEVTYALAAGGTSVYFAADTLVTPEVRTIAERGPFDVVLLPVNGLRVNGDPAVSSAEESALFAGLLQAEVAVPTHYCFSGGVNTDDRLLTYNGTPWRFLHSLERLAPDTLGCVLEPGERQTFT